MACYHDESTAWDQRPSAPGVLLMLGPLAVGLRPVDQDFLLLLSHRPGFVVSENPNSSADCPLLYTDQRFHVSSLGLSTFMSKEREY